MSAVRPACVFDKIKTGQCARLDLCSRFPSTHNGVRFLSERSKLRSYVEAGIRRRDTIVQECSAVVRFPKLLAYILDYKQSPVQQSFIEHGLAAAMSKKEWHRIYAIDVIGYYRASYMRL